MKTRFRLTLWLVCLTALLLPIGGYASTLEESLQAIAHQWVRINYQLPEKEQGPAFAALTEQAHALVKANPDKAEPLFWEATILANHAEIEGGVAALSKAKRARDLLLGAEKIDPRIRHGALYALLGSLYGKVPGWPIGFGDKDKARQYFEQALKIDPNGMDANYFYADFLADQNDYAKAQSLLNKALTAPPRVGEEDLDTGRRRDIAELQAEIRKHLKP